ncbi:MAG: TolC family protein [Planctomycetia bacterium]|jgi:outer membrane protein TolC
MLQTKEIRSLAVILAAMIALFFLAVSAAGAAESLEDAWAVASSVNHSIHAARWETAAACQRYEAARAEQMPMISGSAQYRVLDNPVTVNAHLPPNPLMPQGATLPMQVMQQDFLISGVDLTQPIYTFGRLQNQISAAAYNVRAERSDQRTIELDLRLQVSQAYVNVLTAQHVLDVANISILSLKKHLNDVKNLLDQGVVVRNDYLAVEVSLAKAEQSKIYAENLLKLTRATYNRLLLRSLEAPVELQDLREPNESYDIELLTQQAIALRPELTTISAQATSLDRMACSVEASHKPQLSLSGRFDYIGNDYLQRQGYTSVGLVGKWNLFDAGRVHHQAGEYRRKAAALRQQRADTETFISLQVRQAWLDLDTTRRQLAVNRKAITSADENFSVAANRYKEGVGTNTEVLDAERLRTETYSNFYTSRYATVLAQMKLKRAVGTFGPLSGESALGISMPKPVRLPLKQPDSIAPPAR